jgi:hypothetical protein
MNGGPSVIDRIESLSIFVEGLVTWAIQPLIVLGFENQEVSRFTLADALALSFQIGIIGLLTLGHPEYCSSVSPAVAFTVGSLIALLLWSYAIHKLSVCDIVSFARRFAALMVVFPLWAGGVVTCIGSIFALSYGLSQFALTAGAGLFQLILARCTANHIAEGERQQLTQ